jgi:hypothetical protein
MKIEEGNVNDIVCPQVNCFAIIANETIEKLVSKETAQRYIHFDIKSFVDSNPNIKWCPHPGCGMAIRNPKNFKDPKNILTEFSISVDCGQGHISCWYH